MSEKEKNSWVLVVKDSNDIEYQVFSMANPLQKQVLLKKFAKYAKVLLKIYLFW